ncbi:MAG: hypothetical protein LBS87_01350, partial [Puniceicoccales bacterium]|nr:hypothetical protein [Puniceicoccales bacterium]
MASLPQDMQNEMDVDKFTSLNGLTEDALNEWRDSVGLNNVPELVKRAAGIPTTNKEARDKSGALRSVSVMQPVPLSQLRALTKEEIKAAANLDSNTLARLAALPAVGAAGGGAGGTLDLIMTLPDAQAHPAYVGRNKNFLLELGDLDNGELQALAGLAAAQVQELETMPDPARRALATLNPATLAGIGGAAFTPAVLQDLGNPASNAAVILGLLKTYMDQNGANPVALQTALNDVVTAVYPGVAGAPLVAPIGGGAWPAGAPAAGAIAMTQAVMQDLRNHPQALPALAAAGVTPAALLAGGTVVGAGGVPAPAAIAAAIQGAAAAPIAAANANALAQLSQLTLCALSVLNANTLLVLGALPQAVSGLGQLTFPTVTALGGLPAAALQDLANNAGAVAGFGVLGTGIVPAGAPAPAGTLAALAGAAAPVLSALRKNFVTQNSLRELRGVQAQL